MSVIGIDLGGTKLALALFSDEGEILQRVSAAVGGRAGREIGALIREQIHSLVRLAAPGPDLVRAVGIAIPGIYHAPHGRVWAPNLPGWDDYPLRDEIRDAVGPEVRVDIDSDRAAYVLGDLWRGAARGCRDAIFLAVGTGIGAGILCNGEVLRGRRDVAGAIGWLALDRPYREEYRTFGCFEYQASGPGLVRYARDLLRAHPEYAGLMAEGPLTTEALFTLYDEGDPIARSVLDNAVELWGMAVANLVSLFDPEVVVLGGGIFGPAVRFLDRIREQAVGWGQPISTPQVRLEVSSLGGDAGLYGAGHLALRSLTRPARS